ncbi:MAG TPA: N-acetyl-gamma-glutamyl-phosphate reductase [Bacteroidota bacterium]
MDSISAAVIGASGYSGAELISLLGRHRFVRLGNLFAHSSAGKQLDEVFPRFTSVVKLPLESYSPEAACSNDVIFIALPSGEAMNIVPELLKRGKRIIDLGGDFRLKDPAVYEQYYRRPHTAPDQLKTAVYGLPEWNRSALKTAKLVANPGCYPTGATLPLLPLLKKGLIRKQGIVVSSLSGVSGAGRSASTDLSFTEVNESVRAYKVGVHQHLPEIQSVLSGFSGDRVTVTFVPHLLPITRGIYTSLYAPMASEFSLDTVTDIYAQYYGGEPFVRFSPDRIPEIKNVTGTNFIDIGYRLDRENKCLIILSVIDNLVKGAAGQAIQNMNTMFGFDETEALI